MSSLKRMTDAELFDRLKQNMGEHGSIQGNDIVAAMLKLREEEDMETMTYKEASGYLHVSESTLRKWVMDKWKEIPFYKVGKRVLFFREELEEWIRTNPTGNGEEA